MKRLVLLIGFLFLMSCAFFPAPEYKPEHGVRYLTASWYGPKFNGRPTSSGERYDMYGLTAAHKTLKFGTKLKVTNPDTGKSVVVTVNDRGPFIRGRDLDLSLGAARAIGFEEKGVGKVRVEYVGRDMRYVKRIPYIPAGSKGSLTVQVGSFKDASNAERLRQGLALAYKGVYVAEANVKGSKYYRVRVGKFNDYDSAYAVAEKLSDEGYKALIMKVQ